jgi:lipoprotein-anchoring transpeptidase ErfK/SrfK
MENDTNIIHETRPESGMPKSGDGNKNSVVHSQEENSFWQNLKENRKLSGMLKGILFTMAILALLFCTLFFVLYLTPLISEVSNGHKVQITSSKELRQSAPYKKQVSQVSKDIQLLSRKYNAYSSGQSYIVINTTDNRFYLYRNKKLIREGYCSSGSYTMLQTEGNKRWIFKTPKGKYWIHGKTTNPVWKKPDWAFVEEGLPIPSENDNSRYEYGVLGDYAMAIGDGYMIHGTIYKRFLGMPVTHGCVRLNDEDLEIIYNTLSIGSKVYIF